MEMNTDEIVTVLEEIFQQNCQSQTIQLSLLSTRNDVPQWTSMNHMLVIAAIEKKFNITFNLQEAIAASKDIHSMVQVLVQKLKR